MGVAVKGSPNRPCCSAFSDLASFIGAFLGALFTNVLVDIDCMSNTVEKPSPQTSSPSPGNQPVLRDLTWSITAAE
jgi:hypothetical protein